MGQNRVELLTPALSEQCSNRLSYWPRKRTVNGVIPENQNGPGASNTLVPGKCGSAFAEPVRRTKKQKKGKGRAGFRPRSFPKENSVPFAYEGNLGYIAGLKPLTIRVCGYLLNPLVKNLVRFHPFQSERR